MRWLIMLILMLFTINFLQAIGYQVDGNFTSITRIGLSNNKKVDPKKAIYPNNSFWALSTQLGFILNLLEKDHQLNIGIKGMVGGVGLDTTRKDSTLFPSNTTLNSNEIGKFSQIYMPAWGEIINAYLSYQYKEYFGIKLGRYSFTNLDWWSGHNQGAEFFIGNENFKTYAVYTHARSSSGGEWLNHFDPRNGDLNLFGIFTFGIDYNPLLKNQKLLLRYYSYYQPNAFFSTGFKVVWDSNKNFNYQGVNFKTTLLTLFSFHNKDASNKISGQDWGYETIFDLTSITPYNPSGYLGRTRGKGGITLFLREDILINRHNVGAGIYKNFGNPNDLIGSYGDPTGLNTWVYTLYGTGPTWSDFFSQDAFNVFLFGGGKYNQFGWDLIARYTHSMRSNENSLALLLNYDITKHINLNLRLEWAGTTNHKGYLLSQTFLQKDVYTDKSMVFWYITAKI
ncbi:outer membrane family protein [Helicobacter sp. faydin-H20]|uniref:outer membrane family protein n=1 Tax=Helicobacter anatolicus TaxID=2905874 RepID=UPI001E2A345B|nr:outer membrane family protein [Helicobacter anatolicus]MCE3036459.1 outer membrane family protein [Helicobacter anatolicus]